MIQALDNIIR